MIQFCLLTFTDWHGLSFHPLLLNLVLWDAHWTPVKVWVSVACVLCWWFYSSVCHVLSPGNNGHLILSRPIRLSYKSGRIVSKVHTAMEFWSVELFVACRCISHTKKPSAKLSEGYWPTLSKQVSRTVCQCGDAHCHISVDHGGFG